MLPHAAKSTISHRDLVKLEVKIFFPLQITSVFTLGNASFLLLAKNLLPDVEAEKPCLLVINQGCHSHYTHPELPTIYLQAFCNITSTSWKYVGLRNEFLFSLSRKGVLNCGEKKFRIIMGSFVDWIKGTT